MGIKSLSLQMMMIPWCFHVDVGSADAACDHPDPPASRGGDPAICIRLIRADGRVEVYDNRQVISAAELMEEQPMHLVCRSDAFTIGQRIPALAEGDKLQPGRSYFLLPIHVFQSVLSFVTLASSFARASASASASSPLLQRLFEVHKTPSGKLQIRVSEDFIGRIQEAQEVRDGGGGAVRGAPGQGGGSSRVCTTAALEKDYMQLVVGCRVRRWKPKLETITESERKREKLSAVGGDATAGGALDGIRRRSYKKSYPHEVEHRGRDQRQKQQKKQKQELKEKAPASDLPKRKNSARSCGKS